LDDERIYNNGMHGVLEPELPDAQGYARAGTAGVEEVLPVLPEAYAP
jgi:hypothetical protein